MRQLVALAVIAAPSLSVAAQFRAVPRASIAVPALSAAAASPAALSAAPAAAAFQAVAPAAARPQLLEDRLVVPTISYEADSVRMIAIRSDQPLEATASRVDEYFDGRVASGVLTDAKLELSDGELRMKFAGSHDGVNRAAEDFRKLTSTTQRLPAGKSRLFRDSLLPVGPWNPKMALASDVTKVLPPDFQHRYFRQMRIEGRKGAIEEFAAQASSYLSANGAGNAGTFVHSYSAIQRRPAYAVVQIRDDAEVADRLAARVLRLAGLPARMEP